MIIGRKEEFKELKRCLRINASQLVVLYGRMRIGKTYLVDEVFKNNYAFKYTGVSNISMSNQLKLFGKSLEEQGLGRSKLANWAEAFNYLKEKISELKTLKKVVFLDEASWLDSSKSDFMPALKDFWVNWASQRRDIILIVCSSFMSWLQRKFAAEEKGLRDSITVDLELQPLVLQQCKELLASRNLEFSKMSILQFYMVLGGVPYYWTMLKDDMNVVENIKALFLAKNAPLRLEFNKLFNVLFKSSELYIEAIKTLGKSGLGLTRKELINRSALKNCGQTTNILLDLENCGFIRKFNCFGKKNKESVYQLTDNYLLFYFQMSKMKEKYPQLWLNIAFGCVCFQHLECIKKKLGIVGVETNEYIYKYENGRLWSFEWLIDRNDKTINFFEIKYTKRSFEIDAECDAKLRERVRYFEEQNKSKKEVKLTLISTNELLENEYSGIVQNMITLSDLFQKV